MSTLARSIAFLALLVASGAICRAGDGPTARGGRRPRAAEPHAAAAEIEGLAEAEAAADRAEKELGPLLATVNDDVRVAAENAALRVEAIRSVRVMMAEGAAQLRRIARPQAVAAWKEGVEYYLRCARERRDPFEGALSGVRACRSRIDGNLLLYRFRLPRDFRPDRRYPLEVTLHSAAQLTWKAGWVDGKPSTEPRSAGDDPVIVIHPCGRGNNSYAGMGEVAVIEVIQDAKRHYPVDADRVTVGGNSMGGTGGFRLGGLYPDLFSAARSMTGGPFYGVPRGDGRFDAMLLMDNFANTGMVIWDAPKEGHFQTNRAFAEGLKERAARFAGHYPVLELTDQEGGHGQIAAPLREQGMAWMRKQVRNPFPPRVVFKTYCLRRDGAYWAHIDTAPDTTQPSRIEAHYRDGSVTVKLENVDGFRLDLAPGLVGSRKEVVVTVDGEGALRVPGGETTHFARQGGRWTSVGRREPSGLVKRRGVSGPILDVFMGEPVLMVYGSALSASQANVKIDAALDRMFGPPDGSWLLRTGFPRKMDRDVTAADIERCHLVLFGDPGRNALLNRIAAQLPVRFLRDGYEIGGRTFREDGVGLVMVYPNPLNRDRYVLLVPEDYQGGRPLTYGDYVLVLPGGRPNQGGRILAEGDFDARWQPLPPKGGNPVPGRRRRMPTGG